MNEIGFNRFCNATLSTVVHQNGRILHADLPPNLATVRQNFRDYLDSRKPPSFCHWGRYMAFMYRFHRDWKNGRFGQNEHVEALRRHYPDHESIISGWAVPFSQIKGQVTVTINDLAFILFSNIYLAELLSGEIALVMPENGVAEYVNLLVSKTKATFKTQAPIRKLVKSGGQFHFETSENTRHTFDRVIIASGAADTREFIQPWDEELLSLFKGPGFSELYEESLSVIHTDPGVMKGIPKRFWGTGAFHYDPVRNDNTVTLYVPGFYGYDEEIFVTYLRTYDMNVRSGEIPPAAAWNALPEICRIDSTKILDVAVHRHPRWGSVEQRTLFQRLHDYRGKDGLYFCGVGLDGKTPLVTKGPFRRQMRSSNGSVRKKQMFLRKRAS